MFLKQDIGKWLLPIIANIGIISIICFIIIGDVLGIISLFSNPTLAKTLFGVFLFFPATFILFLTLLYMVWGFWLCISDNGDGTKSKRGFIMLKQAMIASLLFGTFILLSDVIFLKVPFGIHLLFGYCFLLILLFAMQIYKTWSAIPEEDTKAWFIAFLKNILPIQFQEEWLGDLQEQHYLLIEDGTPLWKVYFITLFTGLGLIRSYLWLKADKFVSRWMTRVSKVFLG
ncbi:MAG: hypothetical protein JGK37_20785 [Microcoleus sp. PH2017_06_SFM_O_A]|nr:hypothetical protein [Microcoleus sp. PH2017_06_SFM_O_A]